MPMIKYSPFQSEVEDFPTGLRVFQDSLSRLFSEPASRPWSPAVDISETENELILKADLPDIDPKNVGIQLENGTLTLKGERKFEEQKGGQRDITGSSVRMVPLYGLSAFPIRSMETTLKPTTRMVFSRLRCRRKK